MSYGEGMVSAVCAFDAQGRLTDITAERFNDARTQILLKRTRRNPPSSDEPTT